jgi:putative tricarboxylic transport membrane protein
MIAFAKVLIRGKVGAALVCMSLAVALLPFGVCQAADKYPAKPILIVVPFAPGGGADIMVRNLDKIATDLKVFPRRFVIENKVGGSGVVGRTYARERPADGYTLVVTENSTLYADLLGNAPWSYKDFTYVARLVSDYNMIVVLADSPYKTLKELIGVAKKKPKSIKVGGTGVGGPDMVQLAMFSKAGGGEYNYVAFDSGGQVVTNLLGGHVDAALANPSEAYEQMRAGKVRSLGISSPDRIAFKDPIFKDIPIWKESGVNLTASQWRSIGGPPGMKKEHVDWLIQAFKKITDSKEWEEGYLEKFQQINAFVGGADFQKEVDQEYELSREIFKELGLLKKK